MSEIYIFSGLGADERVFQKLNFSDFKVTLIKWVIPQNKETIESYSKRITEQIKSEQPVLIGLSFGGIIAIEVAKHIQTEKIILIASAKTKHEIPFYYRLIGLLRIHKIIPTKFFKQVNFLTNWFFGVENEQEKILLKNIITDTNPVFLKWAIDKIVNWTNETIPANLVHIHGTKDRILPFHFVKCDIKLSGGGHFMTVNDANELSHIFRSILNN